MSEMKQNVYSWFNFKEHALLKMGLNPDDYRIKEAMLAAVYASYVLPDNANEEMAENECEAQLLTGYFYDYTSDEEKQELIQRLTDTALNFVSEEDREKFLDTLAEVYANPDFDFAPYYTLVDLDENNHRISIYAAANIALEEMNAKYSTSYEMENYLVEDVFNSEFADEMKATRRVYVAEEEDERYKNRMQEGTWAHFIRAWEIEESKGITRAYPFSFDATVQPTKIARIDPSPDIAGGRTQVFFEGAEDGQFLIDHGTDARFNYDPKGINTALTCLKKFHDEDKVTTVNLFDMSAEAIQDWLMAAAALELDGISMKIKMAPEMRSQVYTDEFNRKLDAYRAFIQEEKSRRSGENTAEDEAQKAALQKAEEEALEARKIADMAQEAANTKLLDPLVALDNETTQAFADAGLDVQAHKLFLSQEYLRDDNDMLVEIIAARAENVATLKERLVEDLKNGTNTVKPEDIAKAEEALDKAWEDWSDFAIKHWEEIEDLEDVLGPDDLAPQDLEPAEFEEETPSVDAEEIQKALRESENWVNPLNTQAERELADDLNDLDAAIMDLESQLPANDDELAEIKSALIRLENLEKKMDDEAAKLLAAQKKAEQNAAEKASREKYADILSIAEIATKDAKENNLGETWEYAIKEELLALGETIQTLNISKEEIENSEEYKNFEKAVAEQDIIFELHDTLSNSYAEKATAYAGLLGLAITNEADAEELAKAEKEFYEAQSNFYAFIEDNRDHGKAFEQAFVSFKQLVDTKAEEIEKAQTAEEIAAERALREKAIEADKIATLAAKDAEENLLFTNFNNRIEQETESIIDDIERVDISISEIENADEFKTLEKELNDLFDIYRQHDDLSIDYAEKAVAFAVLQSAAIESEVDAEELAKAEKERDEAQKAFYDYVEANRDSGKDFEDAFAAFKLLINKKVQARESSLGSVSPEKEQALVDEKANVQKQKAELFAKRREEEAQKTQEETGSKPGPKVLDYVPNERQTRKLVQDTVAGKIAPFYISAEAAMSNIAEFVRFEEDASSMKVPFSVFGDTKALNEAIAKYKEEEAAKRAQAQAQTQKKDENETEGKKGKPAQKIGAVEPTTSMSEETEAKVAAFMKRQTEVKPADINAEPVVIAPAASINPEMAEMLKNGEVNAADKTDMIPAGIVSPKIDVMTYLYQPKKPEVNPEEAKKASQTIDYIPNKRQTKELVRNTIDGKVTPFYISTKAAMKNIPDFVRFVEEADSVKIPFTVNGSKDEIKALNKAIAEYEEQVKKAAANKAEKPSGKTETVADKPAQKPAPEAEDTAAKIAALRGVQSTVIPVGTDVPEAEPVIISPVASVNPEIKNQDDAVIVEAIQETSHTVKATENTVYDLSDKEGKTRALKNKYSWLSGVNTILYDNIVADKTLSDAERAEKLENLKLYMEVYKAEVDNVINNATGEMDKTMILQEALKKIGTLDKFDVNSGASGALNAVHSADAQPGRITIATKEEKKAANRSGNFKPLSPSAADLLKSLKGNQKD
ncbi:MAG: hypothetical protein IKD08_02585 [Alphaproteobacteria bacterium]|nr:hypothetical protein [Alphaproteobacteria bacterium]